MKKAISQRSKGEIVVSSILIILFVGVVASFAVIALTQEKQLTPHKVTNLMLQDSDGSGGGLSTTFTIPE